MILVDLNQVLISNLMVQTRGKAEVKPNMEMVRSMVLNSLRGFNLKFRDEYGKMVLCSDAANPWRRKVFPNYKHGRRKGRTDSDTDWDNIFAIMAEIKKELVDNFPYAVMHVENAEADDMNQSELIEALKMLDDRSKDILQRRYLADDKATLHELAEEYDVSAERIRQIENGALKKLKAIMVSAA